VNTTFAPRGTVDIKSGVATLHGTYTCTNAIWIGIYGDLSQPVGRVATVRGSFIFEGTCDGTSRTWSAEVAPLSGKFAGGNAPMVGGSFACGAVECADGGVTEQTVRLSVGKT
jgi:hypothetical protein